MGTLGWRRVLQGLFVAAVLAILAAPMAVQLALGSEPRRGENRAPAALPPWPDSVAALPGWTAGMDAWAKDHFGLRGRYLDLLDQVLYRVFGAFASPQVLPGREGRIFLASHVAGEAHRNSLIRTACGAGVAPEQPRAIARAMAAVLEGAEAAGLGRSLAILVPSAAALYPSQLPPWLERQCRGAVPLAESVAAAVPDGLRPRVASLQAVLAALDPAMPAIPRHNFHWDGAGPLQGARWIAETMLQRRPGFALPTRVVRKRSDIAGFFPGLRIEADVIQADEGAAGVVSCIGPPCFAAALGAEAALRLADLRRYDSPRAQGRLLLLTDSFGAFVAAGFTPYFGQVVQVSLNNLPHLTPAQRARLRRFLAEEVRPDATVFLLHDAAATYYWDMLLRDLLGAAPRRG